MNGCRFENYIGGICAFNRNIINNCYNIGKISSTNSSHELKGGIIGATFNGKLVQNNYDNSGVGAIGGMNFYGAGDTVDLTESQIINYIKTDTRPTIPTPTYAIDNRLKGGIYVKYDTSTLPDEEIPADLTGYSQNQYSCPSKYSKGWRVLINDGSVVKLISADNINVGISRSSNSKKFYLKGEIGFKNGIVALNNVSKAYLNTSLATDTNSIGSPSIVPDLSKISLIYKPSNYSIFNTENLACEDLNMMTFSDTDKTPTQEEYWCANQFIYTDRYNGILYTDYSLWFSDGTRMPINTLYEVEENNDIYEWEAFAGVRPVITLRNDLEIKSGTGTSGDPYVLGVK